MGKKSDDFYWRQKSSSLNLVQIIPPVGLLYFTSKIFRLGYIDLEVKYNRPTGGIICLRLRELDFCLQ